MTRTLKSSLLLLAISALSACSVLEQASPDEAALRSGLVGQWKLVEFIADPGDGSATWTRADGRIAEFLHFRADGGFSASTNRFPSQFHSYRVLDEQRVEMLYNVDVATQSTHTWYFRDVTATTLTLDYFCIERCSGRYVRIR